MARSIPSFRGWLLLLLAGLSYAVCLALLPPVRGQSGVGEWLIEPVSNIAKLVNGSLVFVCFAAEVALLWRGALADKVVAVVGLLMTSSLLTSFLWHLKLPIYSSP